jgi:hypothetical protein
LGTGQPPALLVTSSIWASPSHASRSVSLPDGLEVLMAHTAQGIRRHVKILGRLPIITALFTDPMIKQSDETSWDSPTGIMTDPAFSRR